MLRMRQTEVDPCGHTPKQLLLSSCLSQCCEPSFPHLQFPNKEIGVFELHLVTTFCDLKDDGWWISTVRWNVTYGCMVQAHRVGLIKYNFVADDSLSTHCNHNLQHHTFRAWLKPSTMLIHWAVCLENWLACTWRVFTSWSNLRYAWATLKTRHTSVVYCDVNSWYIRFIIMIWWYKIMVDFHCVPCSSIWHLYSMKIKSSVTLRLNKCCIWDETYNLSNTKTIKYHTWLNISSHIVPNVKVVHQSFCQTGSRSNGFASSSLCAKLMTIHLIADVVATLFITDAIGQSSISRCR